MTFFLFDFTIGKKEKKKKKNRSLIQIFFSFFFYPIIDIFTFPLPKAIKLDSYHDNNDLQYSPVSHSIHNKDQKPSKSLLPFIE